MQHPLLTSTTPYVREEELFALQRYQGFAADFFSKLYRALPAFIGRFEFYRQGSSSDLWAVYPEAPQAFVVQLDPDCQVICLWNATLREEIGCWPPSIEDPVAHAIHRIRQSYFLEFPDGR